MSKDFLIIILVFCIIVLLYFLLKYFKISEEKKTIKDFKIIDSKSAISKVTLNNNNYNLVDMGNGTILIFEEGIYEPNELLSDEKSFAFSSITEDNQDVLFEPNNDEAFEFNNLTTPSQVSEIGEEDMAEIHDMIYDIAINDPELIESN